MRVRSIESIDYSGIVYNLACLPDQNYVAEGFVIHNCYKSNPKESSKVMTALTFDRILRKMPQSLTQVALGITDLDANPDLIEIMDICRFWEIVPNLTTSAMGNLALLDDVAKRAGAIAVSIYPHNIEQAYDVICYLTEFYPELQVNAHLLYHNGNPYFVETIINDCSEDPKKEFLLVWIPAPHQSFSPGWKITRISLAGWKCS